MANYPFIKKIRVSGDKGDRGDAPTNDTTVPYDGLIYYDGNDLPQGYVEYDFYWDFTESLNDSINGKAVTLANLAARNSNGIELTHSLDEIDFGYLPLEGKAIEIDVSNFDFKGDIDSVAYFINISDQNKQTQSRLLQWESLLWEIRLDYISTWDNSLVGAEHINDFDGHTIKFTIKNSYISLYIDNNYINKKPYTTLLDYFSIGGNNCYDVTISGVRVYTLPT